MDIAILALLQIFMCYFFEIVQCSFIYNPFEKRLEDAKPETLPWCGILRINQNVKLDAATGLILIARKAAIACANDVAKISKTNLRLKTKALFFSVSNVPKICNVTDYILHPEYDERNVNTLAIVKLEQNDPIFEWNVIGWPKIDGPNNSPRKKLFSIGFTDEKMAVEQTRYEMVQVNKINCVDFYNKEGISFQQFWPTYFECFKRMNSTRTCVDDAGMALASYHGNPSTWTLIGMSSYGPGCVLPARYIQFAPYVPWLKKTLNIKLRRSGFQGFQRSGSGFQGFRRQNDPTTTTTTQKPEDTPNVQETAALEEVLPNELFENLMQVHLDHINDDNSTLVMAVGPMNSTLSLEGNCSLSEGYRPGYVEDGTFDVGDGKPGRVLYALAMYDMLFSRITCVKAFVNCDKHSEIKVNMSRGFQQEDIGGLVKRIPIKSPLRDPAIPARIIDLTGSYDIYRDAIVNLIYLVFEFTGAADIRIELWGVLAKFEATTPISTTIPRNVRNTTYTPHMRGGPGANTAWRLEKKSRRVWGMEPLGQWED